MVGDMKKYILTLILLCCFLLQCQSINLQKQNDLTALKIISTSPESGSIMKSLTDIKITFSDDLQLNSLDDSSVQVYRLENEQQILVEGSILVEENHILIWTPYLPDLLREGHYIVMLDPNLKSENYIPISNSGDEEYISYYTIIDVSQEVSTEPTSQSNLDRDIPEVIVINELLYDVEGIESDGFQFIELYGTPDSYIHGYVIQFINGADGKITHEIEIPEDSFISENGLYVIADSTNENKLETNVENYDLITNFDPQNGPDSIILFNPKMEIEDVLGYGELSIERDLNDNHMYELSPAKDTPAGVSLSRISHIDTENNQKDFILNQSPSPGELKVEFDHVNEVKPEDDHNLDEDPEENEFKNIINLESVYISELVIDPQQDWDESELGNGVLFDQVVGQGTVGYNDEWIEFTNGSLEELNISHWKIKMLDGTDEEENFFESESVFIFSMGGGLENFKSGEKFIMGNPKGNMKNRIDIQVYNESDEMINFIRIENGNSNSVDDESIFFDENFNVKRKKSDPLL